MLQSKSIDSNYKQKMQKFHFLFMNTVVSFFLCSSFTITAQQRDSNITPRSSLAPTANSSWLSRSGLYAFGFYQVQGNGFAVGVFVAGIPEKTVVWTANRDDPPVSSNAALIFSPEGRLVLQSPLQGQVQDTIITENLSQPASSASMLDSGNFVLYNSSGGIIWQSFGFPTDTLLPTQSLSAGQELFSSVSETDHSTGKFRLKMQKDGNLVQYPTDTPDTAPNSYWSSWTYGLSDSMTLNLDVDGRLYLSNSTGFNIKNITEGYSTAAKIYLAKVDWDGIFRLYAYSLRQDSTWSVGWDSSKNMCDPKGWCGLNSFCFLNDQKRHCRCIPGFSFVNQGNWTSGCERNFTAEGCINKHGTPKYIIQTLENTLWEDVPYFVLSQTTKEGCEQACLWDCNCEAAIFRDVECRMQRLPLRYGRRDMDGGSKSFTFVKVDQAFSTDSNMPKEGTKEMRKDIIIVSCLFVAFILVLLAAFGIVIRRYHVCSYRRIPGNGSIEVCEDIAPISFSYAEMEKMTDCFKEEIGRGSSATVYKGVVMMNSQKHVAVKRLEKVLGEEEREFLTEIKVIGRTHHRNLVRLLGYSLDGPSKILVYEYMSNGSLADLLFAPKKQPNWAERMKISCDIARGILYLHDECETQIIHCDIKPHNILMDENKSAKISDFGLSKLLKTDQTNTFTGIRGTRGYVAPEWHRNMPITVKVDIYSFGVMLLEIICCRRFMDQNVPEDQVILEDWVYRCFEAGQLNQLAGDEKVEPKQLERMIKVALWCILDEPSLRPSMKKVLLMLEGTVDIPIPPNPSYLSCI